MVNVIGPKSFLDRFKQSVLVDEEVVFVAHAGLSKGDNILIVAATGVSEAGGAGSATKLNAVVLEDVLVGAEGSAKIVASDEQAQAIGSLM